MPTKEEIARGGRKRTKRGSTNNGKRIERFAQRRRDRGQASWSRALPERLQNVVVSAENLGAAITFGLSRDSGAFMLTLLLDGERETLWFSGDCDLDAELADVEESLIAMAD